MTEGRRMYGRERWLECDYNHNNTFNKVFLEMAVIAALTCRKIQSNRTECVLKGELVLILKH